MPPPIPFSSPVLNALKFTPEEKGGSRIGPDGLTEVQRARGRLMGSSAIVALVDRFFRKRMVTDAIAEYVPQMRERVCVEGRDEVFVVIYVDRKSSHGRPCEHRAGRRVAGERGVLGDLS